jgi:hypothetical protein
VHVPAAVASPCPVHEGAPADRYRSCITSTVVLLAAILGAAGVAVGVALVLLGGRADPARPDRATGTLRVRAELHTGVEQALLGIMRTLSLVGHPGDAAYGQMYVQPESDTRLLIGSRSEIGRGFRAVIELTRGRAATVLTYSILRLPGDDTVHAAVLQFELLLIEAIRRVDGNADVRLVGRALRDLDRQGPALQPGE